MSESLKIVEKALEEASVYVEKGDIDRALHIVNEVLDLLIKVLYLSEKSRVTTATITTVALTKTVTITYTSQQPALALPSTIRSVNTTFRLGNLAVRVLRVVEAKYININGEYYGAKREDMKIAAIVLEIWNPNDRTYKMPSLSAKPVTDKDRAYELSSWLDLRWIHKPTPDITENAVSVPKRLTSDVYIDPGEKATYSLVFQIPESEEPKILILEASPSLWEELVIVVKLG